MLKPSSTESLLLKLAGSFTWPPVAAFDLDQKPDFAHCGDALRLLLIIKCSSAQRLLGDFENATFDPRQKPPRNSGVALLQFTNEFLPHAIKAAARQRGGQVP
jgi:hypothetical protein